MDPSTEKGRAEEVSSDTGGGAIPPRLPADAQTLPLFEAEDVEAAPALVVLVALALVFLVFSVLVLVFLFLSLPFLVAMAISVAAPTSVDVAAVVTALLPDATLHHQLTSYTQEYTPPEFLLR